MKKTIKNLALILVLVVAFSCIAIQASAADASALKFADCEGGVMITECDKNATGELVIPDAHNGKKVVAIANYAFENCIGLTKVVMSDNITTVGDSAFAGCTAIAEITFSYNLEKIGTDAFFACDALKSVVFYPNLKELGAFSFFDCENLETVVLPTGLVTIPEGAFGECTKLTTLSLPLSIKTIGLDAFVSCEAVKTVYYVGTETAWENNIKWSEGNDVLKLLASRVNFGHDHVYDSKTIKDPDCTNFGTSVNTCVCGNTYMNFKVPALGHKTEKIAEIKATCETTGMTAGEKCTVCGVVTAPPQTIPATGHGTLEELPAAEATCTKSGLTKGSRCTICKKDVVPQEVIPVLPHTFKDANTIPATPDADGKIEGFCTSCNEPTITVINQVTVFTLAKTEYDYNGKARKPVVTVKDSKDNVLVADTDYTVEYAKGRKNPGAYDVKITLKGNYEGTKTLSFQIIPAKAEALKAKATKKTEVKISWNEVAGATGYRIYIFKTADGTAKKKIDPATSNSYVLTKDYNGKALVMGKTYKISVTPYVKTANGKYIFAKEATIIKFKFAPAAPTLKVASNAKGKATLEWTNVAAETGYKVYISEDGGKTFKHYKTFKNWPDKQTFTGLKAGKKYSFKVRAYTNLDSKTTVYGAYSAVKTVTIKK